MSGWLNRLRRCPRPHSPMPPPREARAAPVTGCGWFDSSHELISGLNVTEHDSPDTVAGDLPLSDWLGMQLNGWRPGEAQLA